MRQILRQSLKKKKSIVFWLMQFYDVTSGVVKIIIMLHVEFHQIHIKNIRM